MGYRLYLYKYNFKNCYLDAPETNEPFILDQFKHKIMTEEPKKRRETVKPAKKSTGINKKSKASAKTSASAKKSTSPPHSSLNTNLAKLKKSNLQQSNKKKKQVSDFFQIIILYKLIEKTKC